MTLISFLSSFATVFDLRKVRHQVVLVVSHFSSKHSHVHELEQAVCANLMNHHVAKVSGCPRTGTIVFASVAIAVTWKHWGCTLCVMQEKEFHTGWKIV